MALALTPEMLVGSYELLRATPPFARWKLPPADDVEFSVTRAQMVRGEFTAAPLRIGISAACVGTLPSLLAVMAHEMVHLRQHMLGRDRNDVQHNAEFRRLAASVCRAHYFDPREF